MGKKSNGNISKGQEHFLTPISVVGVVIPKVSSVDDERPWFKLVTPVGIEYGLLTDAEWSRILNNYRWEEVRVRGLFNSSTMTIIPQWVVPCGPTGETEKAYAAPPAPERSIAVKIKKAITEFVLAPAYG